MEREDNKDIGGNSSSSTNFFDFSFFTRLFKPLKMVISLQLRILSLEFKRESERFLEGITSLIFGCFFLSIFWFLLNILIVVALNEFVGLKLFFSILTVTSINLFVAVTLIITARSKMKREFFREAKKVFKDTIDDLKD